MKNTGNMAFEFHYAGENHKNSRRVVFDGNPTQNQMFRLRKLLSNNKEHQLCIIPDVLGLDVPNGHKVATVNMFFNQDERPNCWLDTKRLIKMVDLMNRDFGVQLYNAF